ncbi:hypothetical protein DV707_10740 [Halobellus limi]|uniref:Uncharacterized protein n=1 Tax=Halobellus limi TaxID=699433 RepID=A0A1H5ZJ09_9EURY|nr:hypothetical protein DV707_10740 [Halobellus limi]SEG35637.1 hypothetical protein SAMN04488133_1997 [Halobellus limi]
MDHVDAARVSRAGPGEGVSDPSQVFEFTLDDSDFLIAWDMECAKAETCWIQCDLASLELYM